METPCVLWSMILILSLLINCKSFHVFPCFPLPIDLVQFLLTKNLNNAAKQKKPGNPRIYLQRNFGKLQSYYNFHQNYVSLTLTFGSPYVFIIISQTSLFENYLIFDSVTLSTSVLDYWKLGLQFS